MQLRHRKKHQPGIMTMSHPTPNESSGGEHLTASKSAAADGTATTTTTQTTASPSESSRKTINGNVWAWPYIVAYLFFFMFLLFWIYYAIIRRYWLDNNWKASLPGLDTTRYHKFSMRMHMTTGATGILLGPIQFVPYIRRRCRVVHRWVGRLYCTCGMLACFFGEWFILLKGRLVGGYNMSVAFGFAGLAIGFTSVQTWKTSRHAKFVIKTGASDEKPHFQDHRNWAIRSYAQMVAPALYRYWYIFMEIFGLYRTPIPLRNGGHCDENDYCPDYARLLDAAYCWIYWISAGIVAEIIIYYLPPVQMKERQPFVALYDQSNDDNAAASDETERHTMIVPLISSNSDEINAADENNHENSTTTAQAQNPSSSSYGTESQPLTSQSTEEGYEHASARVVNFIGVVLALATITTTGGMFHLFGKNK